MFFKFHKNGVNRKTNARSSLQRIRLNNERTRALQSSITFFDTPPYSMHDHARDLTMCLCLKCTQIAWKTSQQSQGHNLEEVGQKISQKYSIYKQFLDTYVSRI